MRAVAPSIFTTGQHDSRSQRYTYIPTIDVLRGLRKEGFGPFMVTQSKSRIEGKAEYTKHMIGLRRARDGAGLAGSQAEANEIILINSHDGASSYQMLAGMFRDVCSNGLVMGTVANDIRISHKGNFQGEVIEGAFRVLEDFEAVNDAIAEMKALTLKPEESQASAARRWRCAFAALHVRAVSHRRQWYRSTVGVLSGPAGAPLAHVNT